MYVDKDNVIFCLGNSNFVQILKMLLSSPSLTLDRGPVLTFQKWKGQKTFFLEGLILSMLMENGDQAEHEGLCVLEEERLLGGSVA